MQKPDSIYYSYNPSIQELKKINIIKKDDKYFYLISISAPHDKLLLSVEFLKNNSINLKTLHKYNGENYRPPYWSEYNSIIFNEYCDAERFLNEKLAPVIMEKKLTGKK